MKAETKDLGGIIYKATNNINGMVYVGLTGKTLNQRISRHYCYGEFYFGSALRKYGRDNFTFEIIDTAETRKELGEKERYWIKFYNCKAPNGYNLTDGGECGYERSAETKKKMSEARKLFFATAEGLEARRLLSERGKVRVILQETKDKIAASLRGRPGTRLGKKGTPWTEERKEKELPRFKALNIGRVRTAEARKACSEGQKRLASEPGYVNPMSGKDRPDLAERNKSADSREKSRLVGRTTP